jgi:hypothetical protein
VKEAFFKALEHAQAIQESILWNCISA